MGNWRLWFGERRGRGYWLWVGRDADKTVAFAGDGLEEARAVGVFTENVPNFANGSVDAVFGVDEDLGGPEEPGDLGAGDEAAAGGRQEDEKLHRLAFETQRRFTAAQLETLAVQMKLAELEDAGVHMLKISWREVYRRQATDAAADSKTHCGYRS